MKPIEETWDWFDGRLYMGADEDGAAEDIADIKDEERLKLAACAPEMARMLMDLMDGMGPHNPWSCCYCGIEVNGWTIAQQKHLHDCPWLLLMQKAGLR